MTPCQRHDMQDPMTMIMFLTAKVTRYLRTSGHICVASSGMTPQLLQNKFNRNASRLVNCTNLTFGLDRTQRADSDT